MAQNVAYYQPTQEQQAQQQQVSATVGTHRFTYSPAAPGQVYGQQGQVMTYNPEGQTSGQPGGQLQMAYGSAYTQRHSSGAPLSGGSYSASQPVVTYSSGGYPLVPAPAAAPLAEPGKKTKTVLIVLVVIFVGIPVVGILITGLVFCIILTSRVH